MQIIWDSPKVGMWGLSFSKAVSIDADRNDNGALKFLTYEIRLLESID